MFFPQFLVYADSYNLTVFAKVALNDLVKKKKIPSFSFNFVLWNKEEKCGKSEFDSFHRSEN